MGFLQLLTDNAQIWTKYPVPFAIAFLLGASIGYFLSRLRHQATIEAQKERLSHKDDVIKFKDEAIGAASAAPSVTGSSAVLPEVPVSIAPAAEDPRFREINAKIIAETEAAIRGAVLSTTYTLVFNPVTNRAKKITFDANGDIGEGQNGNEHKWRIKNGRLEILNIRSEVYSRFFLLPDKQSLHHTNDADTKSIKGQYLTPVTR